MKKSRAVLLDDSPSTPIFERIYQNLEDRIKSGKIKIGERLPSEMELMREFSVSRQPVRFALDRLEVAGLIYRAQGRGSFVRERLAGFGQELQALGHQVSVRSLQMVERPADAVEAQMLEVKPGDPLIALRRLYYSDAEPLAIFDIRLRPIIPLQGFQQKGDFRSFYELLRELGIELWNAKETVSAQLLSDEDAAILGVTPPAPALLIRRVACLPDGTPFEYAVYRVRADRYEYSTHLGM